MKNKKLSITWAIGILFMMLSPSFAKDVSLSWGTSTGATGYRIYCQADNPNPPFPLCGDTRNTSTTHTVSGLNDNKSYSFAVTAYNQYGESPYSNIVTEKTTVVPAPDNNSGSTTGSGNPLTGQTEITDAWKKVTLSRSFADPIVIVGPPSYRDAAAGVIQLRNVQSNSFEIRFKEWTYLDGKHGSEKVSYLVMEEGRHTMSDGAVWEAGSFYLGSSGNLTNQVFISGLSSTPVLLLTAQTSDDGDKPVMVRAENLTSRGFSAGLFTQESLLGSSHAQEKVGYLAISSPYQQGSVIANGTTQQYLLGKGGIASSFVQITEDFAYRLQEDQSKDAETKHTPEEVCALMVGSAHFAQPVTMNEKDTIVVRHVEGSWNPSKTSYLGLRRGSTWYLKGTNSATAAAVTLSFGFGDVQSTDQVFAGDWNDDGVATIGMRRGNTFYLRHTNSSGPADQVFTFGQSSDQVVIGDWNGDGVDTIGLKRGNQVLLKNSNDNSPADLSFGYGWQTALPTDVLLAGDWNGDGVDTLGLKRDNLYCLRNSNSTGDPHVYYNYEQAADVPVVGDWNGNGIDTIGVKRSDTYYLRNSHSSGAADITFKFGEAGDAPLSGKW
ncbi:MAG: fibronectin type III domain-containing protein [Desulfuromonadaceae bacterium]|nr:fibronectin type III domain-containing protein [Desulfuromonadaceae bacterium]